MPELCVYRATPLRLSSVHTWHWRFRRLPVQDRLHLLHFRKLRIDALKYRVQIRKHALVSYCIDNESVRFRCSGSGHQIQLATLSPSNEAVYVDRTYRRDTVQHSYHGI